MTEEAQSSTLASYDLFVHGHNLCLVVVPDSVIYGVPSAARVFQSMIVLVKGKEDNSVDLQGWLTGVLHARGILLYVVSFANSFYSVVPLSHPHCWTILQSKTIK